MKTNSIERKYVVPGDVVIEGDHNPIANVIKEGNKIISTKIGMAEIAYNDPQAFKSIVKKAQSSLN